MKSNRMRLVAVVQYGEGEAKRSRWTNIGIAFENRDRSWTLKLDYLPARMAETTIQMRPFDTKNDDEASE